MHGSTKNSKLPFTEYRYIEKSEINCLLVHISNISELGIVIVPWPLSSYENRSILYARIHFQYECLHRRRLHFKAASERMRAAYDDFNYRIAHSLFRFHSFHSVPSFRPGLSNVQKQRLVENGKRIVGHFSLGSPLF